MAVLTSLQVISVPVSDQDRAKAFYRDVLGFEELADSPMGPEMRWVQLGLPGAQTSITLVTWFDTMPAGSLKGVVLGCEDVDRAAQALADKGLTLAPIESAPWGRYTTFDDPDGNGFVLQSAPSG
jgi:catechol 2,3-dioxygenase-like lactoylglutathione lyase family enzyme